MGLLRQLPRQRLGGALLWLTALVLFLWALRATPLAETWQVARRLGIGQIFILVLVNALILLLLTSRWWLLLWALGRRLPFFHLFGYRLAAFGVSYFTPGSHFGGEPLQVYLVERRHHLPWATTVASVAMDKLLDLLVNFTFLSVGLIVAVRWRLLAGIIVPEMIFWPLLLLAMPAGYLGAVWGGRRPLAALLRLALRLPWWQRWPGGRLRYQQIVSVTLASEDQINRLCRRAPLMISLTLLLSVLAWLLMMGEYWLMLLFLGVKLDLTQMIVALFAARAAILLPLPGALGALEFSQILAMRALGFGPAAGLSASLVIRARDILLGTMGLWWGGRLLHRIGFSKKETES